jgi:hypothetical protein
VAPLPGTITLGQYKVVNDIQVSLGDVPGVPPAFDAFCYGDGSLIDHTTPCPCGNSGAPEHGCANSFDRNGAQLSGSGQPAADTVVLMTTNMPSSAFGMYLQHTLPGDFIFHDGTLCAGGTLIPPARALLGHRRQPLPRSGLPAGRHDHALAARRRDPRTGRCGAITPPGTATPSTSFCPPATAQRQQRLGHRLVIMGTRDERPASSALRLDRAVRPCRRAAGQGPARQQFPSCPHQHERPDRGQSATSPAPAYYKRGRHARRRGRGHDLVQRRQRAPELVRRAP